MTLGRDTGVAGELARRQAGEYLARHGAAEFNIPGITLGQSLETLKSLAGEVLPQGYSIDYGGQSRQYVQESSALLITFFFALIIIFLSLAALFESFRDRFRAASPAASAAADGYAERFCVAQEEDFLSEFCQIAGTS